MTAPLVTDATHAAMYRAVADAQRRGWQLEDSGPGWASMGRMEPVNHVGLALLTILTAGIGLILWLVAASRGPQWIRLVITADQWGRVTITHLDHKGRPRTT